MGGQNVNMKLMENGCQQLTCNNSSEYCGWNIIDMLIKPKTKNKNKYISLFLIILETLQLAYLYVRRLTIHK